MKRSLTAAFAVALSTTAALADGVDGRWADSAVACSDPGGLTVMTVVAAKGLVRYYESQCTIDDWEAIGDFGLAWRGTLMCSGEGETWSKQSVFGIAESFEGGADRLVEIDLTAGIASVRVRCD